MQLITGTAKLLIICLAPAATVITLSTIRPESGSFPITWDAIGDAIVGKPAPAAKTLPPL